MPSDGPDTENALRAEIARLNKIIQALINRAERSASVQGSAFDVFQTAVVLEDQVRRRTLEIERALRENERSTRALRETEQEARRLAFYDALTQVPNRRLLADRLEHALAASRRSGSHGALIYLDLDHFKPLNDQHGHDAGDLLLVEAARRLTLGVRECDTVARIGGDEFVVMLCDLHLEREIAAGHARRISESLRTSLNQPYTLELRRAAQTPFAVEHRCSASIGITLFSADDIDQDAVIQRADRAMYQAKNQGRGTLRFAPE